MLLFEALCINYHKYISSILLTNKITKRPNFMHCRNCGEEVQEKAIACPKCGVNPRTEKKFCPTCGVATNPNQVICVNCGVSLGNSTFSFDISNLPKFDASNLPQFDVTTFEKNKSSLSALVAFIGCLLPWIKIKIFGTGRSFSCFGLSDLVDYAPNTILVSFFLIILPILLLGFVVSDYFPKIGKYKKFFSYGSLMLVIYAAIGLYQTVNPSLPVETSQNDIFGNITRSASELAADAISVGFGFYISFIGTVISFILYNKQGN